jgi:hypothetical protein
MIEVAIVSLERAIIADDGELPEGSTAFACRPLFNPSGVELGSSFGTPES